MKATDAPSIPIAYVPTELGPWIEWKRSLKDKVMAASGVPDLCFPWIYYVEKQGVTFEQLEDSGPFASLDHKLGAIVYDLSQGDLRRRLTNLKEDLARKDRLLTGRQIFWVVNQDFVVDEDAIFISEFTDFQRLKLQGHDLATSFAKWNNKLDAMTRRPEDHVFASMFYAQVHRVQALAIPLAVFEH